MRRRGFQEVALSLTEPGTILHEEAQRDCHQHPFISTTLSSTPVETTTTTSAAFTVRKSGTEHRALHQKNQQPKLLPILQKPKLVQELHASHSPPRRQLIKRLSSHSLHSSNPSSATVRYQPKYPLSRASTLSSLNGPETDSADYESTPVENRPSAQQAIASTSSVVRFVTSVKRKAKTVGRTVSSALSSASRTPHQLSISADPVQNPIKVRPKKGNTMEEMDIEQRLEGWQDGLKAALDQDKHGELQEALEAYDRLNRNITRGAIYDYEQLSCDQKKLLSQVLTCLDMRTQQLRVTLEGSSAQINKAGLASTGPMSKGSITTSAESMALKELSNCIEVIDTIRRMGSKTKVPVVLVYRERKHRTHHRHQDKGQSNKIIFAKEKRDFLNLMGLPGAMVSEKGFDYTVRPNTASNVRRQHEDDMDPGGDKPEGTTEVGGEIEPDEKNGGSAVQTEEDDTDSPKTAKKNLLNYLPFLKKASVSPHPHSDDQDDEEDEEEEEEEEEDSDAEPIEGEEEAADARSTLSCDTCSSADSSDTEEELDDATDMPVSGATYAHKENTQPPPFLELGSSYVTLNMEKLGIKNTARVICPFLRVSVRDSQGNLVTPGFPQETAEWEVVNKNYLRAPSKVHLQRPLEDFPEDSAVFLELRNYRPQKNIISTVCYTFLERHHLAEGSYICELYSLPVDFTRKNLSSYTEKAFFLHLEVVIKQAACEVQSLESPKSTTSS